LDSRDPTFKGNGQNERKGKEREEKSSGVDKGK